MEDVEYKPVKDEETIRKEKMHKRLLWLYIGLCIVLVGYIIFQLVCIFR